MDRPASSAPIRPRPDCWEESCAPCGAPRTRPGNWRTLAPDQLRQALPDPPAVSDIVSGNRPRVQHGDTMMHMQDLWRGQFADPALRRFVDEIDRRAEQGSGYTQDDHARVAITIP